MTIQHHDLISELPQYRDQIHTLKTSDAHFRKLFDQYHDLTKSIENMETEVKPTPTLVEEGAKLQRLKLKDELVSMLEKYGG